MGCGSSTKTTAPSISSGATSSGTVSSGATSSGAASSGAKSSGAASSSAASSSAIVSSSAAHVGAISGFDVSFTGGLYHLVGTLNVTSYPSAISGKVEFGGATVTDVNIAEVTFGEALSQYVLIQGASQTAIPMSGTKSLDGQFVPGDNACVGNYTIIVTATVGAASVVDSVVYNYPDGIPSGKSGCP